MKNTTPGSPTEHAGCGGGKRRSKPPGKGVARPAMGRIIEIHRLLAAKRHPNCTVLAREFEVSRQTVLADIRYMRDQMDLPVEWSQERNGYTYAVEVRDFPTGEIAAGELAAIFLARHTLGNIQATLLGEKVKNVFGAVLETMKEKLRFSWSELDHALLTGYAARMAGERRWHASQKE